MAAQHGPHAAQAPSATTSGGHCLFVEPGRRYDVGTPFRHGRSDPLGGELGQPVQGLATTLCALRDPGLLPPRGPLEGLQGLWVADVGAVPDDIPAPSRVQQYNGLLRQPPSRARGALLTLAEPGRNRLGGVRPDGHR